MRGTAKFLDQIIKEYMKVCEIESVPPTLAGVKKYYHWRAWRNIESEDN